LTSIVSALIVAAAAQTAPPADEMRLMRCPAVHGDNIVFTYASDLWIADRRGGHARRLTTHPGDETRPRISPDGTMVAFTASYDGNTDVYVIPIEGGTPRRLTFEPNASMTIGWTPDGRITYASSAGNFTNRHPRLWIVDPKGGLPQETPLLEVADGTFFSDGKRFAYNRQSSHAMNWRRYRGGRQGKISLYDFERNTYSELPSKRENSWFPMAIGESVYYVSDRNQGTVNLYRYDLATKRDAQLTKFDDHDIKWPSTDGKTIVFERDGYLYSFDVASGKQEKLTFLVRSDYLSARPGLQSVGNQISDFSLSPTGVRLAAVARGDLFSVPARGAESRNMTKTSGAREQLPRWSPDGARIAYISDVTGEQQIYVQPQLGGEPKRLTNRRDGQIVNMKWSPDGKMLSYATRANELFIVDAETGRETRVVQTNIGAANDYDWSPDSKWIAYVNQARNGFSSVYLYEVATGKATQVTEDFYDENNPTFDLTGKYLYFSSARTFSPRSGRYELSLNIQDADRVYVVPLARDTPNPLFPSPEEEPEQGAAKEGAAPTKGDVKIDLDNFGARAIVLPMPASSVPALIGASDGVFYFSGGTLHKFDLKSRESQAILTGGASSIAFNPNRTKLAYRSGPTVGVVDARPGQSVGSGRVDTSGIDAWVDPQAEWKQIYWEAWRHQRDNFYDPKFTGLDWNRVGKHYERYLPFITHRSDLTYVIGLMIGELGTSHAYVSGPGTGSTAPSVSMLGADYEVVGNNVRFKRVFKGLAYDDSRRGPLGEAGVNVNDGDYLLEIDGSRVDARTHPNSLLLNKSNRIVTITVNDRPTLEGARRFRVRPVSNETDLRHTTWVDENRRKVEQMSGGRIGYIHYPSTATDGQIEFIRGYFAQTDKDAVILDGRFNSGGFIQPMVVPTLARQPQAMIMWRNRLLESPELVGIAGPKVMLINSYAGSGGDFTPWMFKNAGLGKLIGTRTLGGLVGIRGYIVHMDGGQTSAPEFAFYDPQTGQWIAENTGVEPDIEVDARPDLLAQGRDPQLERGVQELMAELAKQKPRNVQRGPLPHIPPKN
jgi:tricorn protease